MTFDLERVLASKRSLRQRLTNLPVTDKLMLLESLRTRALELRAASACASAERSSGADQENPK